MTVGVSELTIRWPRWLRDLDQTLAVHSQFVLWGNIRDVFVMPPEDSDTSQEPAGTLPPPRLMPLLDCLWECLRISGYEFVAVHDPVDGIEIFPATAEAMAAAEGILGERGSRSKYPADLDRLVEPMRKVVGDPPQRAAFVLDYASRLVSEPEHLTAEERRFLTFAEKLSHTAETLYLEHARSGPLYNPVIWLVNQERDLPGWLVIGNEAIRSIPLPLPDREDRQQAARALARSFDVDLSNEESTVQDALRAFANTSDGMTLDGMIEATRLALDQDIPFTAVDDAVRSYKIGILDQPWKRDFLVKDIAAADEWISDRVLGQVRAVNKALDILKRSVVGLSGAQTAHGSNRPRGVLFFAGPTGVGKTELAKCLTEAIFGDEQAYIRFDMSEFSAEHSADRLIGAPPGYLGHDAGGELTDALRQRPFSLILFDEVEKAHPRILDKFLQILEDGRLTDGRGETVHFSESVLVFTSNLGMVTLDSHGSRVQNVDPETHDTEDVEARLEAAIREHFITVMNRPELLNRIGNNIVVFDFIRPPIADKIFDLQLSNVCRNVERGHGARLVVCGAVEEELRRLCTADLSNGGRGIGSALETTFINPLSRALFARLRDLGEIGGEAEVLAIERDEETGYRIELT